MKKILKVWFFICFLFLYLITSFLFGCSSKEIKGWCRHEAQYCCDVAGEIYPETRIVRGKSNSVDGYHVQAQALTEDGWVWMNVIQFPFVKIGSEQDDFTPEESYDPDLYYDSRFRKIH